jgi:hypothetical protein
MPCFSGTFSIDSASLHVARISALSLSAVLNSAQKDNREGRFAMSERGDTAQNGGPPEGPKKKEGRRTRRGEGAAHGGARGAAKRGKDRRNERIFMERLAGRSARALAAEFDLSTRQVHDIVKDCRETDIAELELSAQWRSQQFAEEHLLELEEAANSLREVKLAAREQRNVSSELGP